MFQVAELAGGRLSPPFYPTKVMPYVKGEIIESFGLGVVDKETVISFDTELLAIAVGVSQYEARDFWNFYIDGKVVCEHIYTKDLPEGMYFTAIRNIPAGVPLKFEFFNQGGKSKYVWVNYQFLRDPEIG